MLDFAFIFHYFMLTTQKKKEFFYPLFYDGITIFVIIKN